MIPKTIATEKTARTTSFFDGHIRALFNTTGFSLLPESFAPKMGEPRDRRVAPHELPFIPMRIHP
jgi:hypothetical protein